MGKTLTEAQIALLNKRLPKAALKDKPGAEGFTSINAIYVVDRLNEVFGIGKWQVRAEHVETMVEQARNKNGEYTRRMPVVKVTFDIPEYDIHLECFGGNDNRDFGDAYKGGLTDALTKISSWLGIGAGIWRGEYDHTTKDEEDVPAYTKEVLTFLSSTPAAFDYYKKMFKENYRTIDEFSPAQISAIYTHLKTNKRI